MLKNITVGRYIAGDSFLHKATPKYKLIMIFLFIILLFFLNKISTYIFGLLVVVILYKICKIPVKLILNNVKSITFILLFTSIINLAFNRSGTVLFEFLFFKITKESILLTVLVLLRIFLLLSGVAILTYTTLPLDLARCVGDLFSPLKKFNFPVGEISTMTSIAIRFVPLLFDEMQKIIIAQKSRGADISDRNFSRKIRFLVSILVPLLVSSFKRADELAVAMESRCYVIGAKRTRYITFRFNRFDFILIIFMVIFFIFMCLINKFSVL